MIRAFRNFIVEKELFDRRDKILVTVSGGVDSVVMLDLLHRLEMDCVIAHCNFNLRGDESDGDQRFVEQLAQKYGYPLFVESFQTLEMASQNGISIEMAARDLRYNWFESLRQEQGCQWISVGHHTDDVVETLFINLCRGTGIRGLSGIKARNGYVVRPLLNFTRKQLLDYAREFKLEFREDSTNAGLDFVRNKIRHQILPVLQEINPSIRETLMENIHHFSEVEKIYHQSIDNQRQKWVSGDDNGLTISLQGLKQMSAPATFLFEILAPLGFHFRDVQHMAKSIDGISGKVFYSSTHRVIRDRDHFFVSPIEKLEDSEFQINESDLQISYPIAMNMEQLEKPADFRFSTQKHIACVDASRLRFPLLLRRWQKGDSFHPIGMKGHKKVSDYFIDQKFTLKQKENTWLLISGNEIVWVVGHRLDDRFKITKQTQRLYRMEIAPIL